LSKTERSERGANAKNEERIKKEEEEGRKS
jgi:hypothetical protein